LLVDPAPPINWGYLAGNYKDNLKSFDYPRYTQPSYCGIQTETNTIWQMMFDRAWSPVDEIRLTMFEWKVKDDGVGGKVGEPAWDWQYVVHNVVAGQVYGFKASASARPRLVSGSIEPECMAEYTAWLARVQP
jgi:hypothetical protein